MKIGLFGKKLQKDELACLQKLVETLEQNQIEVVVHADFFEQIQKAISFKHPPTLFSENENVSGKFSFLLSLGGDGTLLRTISFLKGTDIPVLGINMGHLGFLTSIGKKNIPNFVTDILNKQYEIEPRSMLCVESEKIFLGEANFALNELCLQRKNNFTLLSVDVFVDNKYLTTYESDGLIIATPTGSTAYSLSCGGPILAPNSNCFVLTPIAAHTLTLRPIIVPDSSEIKISLANNKHDAYLCLDSRKKLIPKTTELIIKKEKSDIKLVRMYGQDFFSNIREKLMWGMKNSH